MTPAPFLRWKDKDRQSRLHRVHPATLGGEYKERLELLAVVSCCRPKRGVEHWELYVWRVGKPQLMDYAAMKHVRTFDTRDEAKAYITTLIQFEIEP